MLHGPPFAPGRTALIGSQLLPSVVVQLRRISPILPMPSLGVDPSKQRAGGASEIARLARPAAATVRPRVGRTLVSLQRPKTTCAGIRHGMKETGKHCLHPCCDNGLAQAMKSALAGLHTALEATHAAT